MSSPPDTPLCHPHLPQPWIFPPCVSSAAASEGMERIFLDYSPALQPPVPLPWRLRSSWLVVESSLSAFRLPTPRLGGPEATDSYTLWGLLASYTVQALTISGRMSAPCPGLCVFDTLAPLLHCSESRSPFVCGFSWQKTSPA